jgi:hypothetical protein
VDLKTLVHRELGEGLTEEDLASAVGVPVWLITDILLNDLPEDPAIWEQFAQYFRVHADFLQSGGPPHSEGLFELPAHTQPSPLGPLRKVPLLRWDQIDQMVTSDEPPRLVHAETLLETDVPGKRTFAVQVSDNSMQPLFSAGEVIFVNPDLLGEPDQYVVVESENGPPNIPLLRQLKEIGGHVILHPLNRHFKDVYITKKQRILGRVVRMRKNL